MVLLSCVNKNNTLGFLRRKNTSMNNTTNTEQEKEIVGGACFCNITCSTNPPYTWHLLHRSGQLCLVPLSPLTHALPWFSNIALLVPFIYYLWHSFINGWHSSMHGRVFSGQLSTWPMVMIIQVLVANHIHFTKHIKKLQTFSFTVSDLLSFSFKFIFILT